MPGGQFRLARVEDCEGMLSIYEPIVRNSTTSFEIKVPSLSEFVERYKKVSLTHPWVVFEDQGKIAGYAYGSPHRSREAYSWSTEVSVYVDPSYQGKGVGQRLYTHLFEWLRSQGLHSALAGIALPNRASEALHKKMGFEKIGTYTKIGYKFSKWHDVTWYQLDLNNCENPEAPTPFREHLQNCRVKPVSPQSPLVQKLIEDLDLFLGELYPPEENQLDSVETLSKGNCHMLGAFLGSTLVGVGALKMLDGYAELKRMYLRPLYRGLGISRLILEGLENEIVSRGQSRVRLETGAKQLAALELYRSSGYRAIPPFGDYQANTSSHFLEKELGLKA